MGPLPECAWDAEHGLVVLYRADADGAAPEAFALVVEPADGTPAYYAGDFPAERRLWAVKAPRGGRFRLLFYPAGSTGALSGRPQDRSADRQGVRRPGDLPPGPALDRPSAAIPFDEGLGLDPDLPAGARNRLSAWLLTGAAGSIAIEPIEVPAGARPLRVFAELGLGAGDGAGMTVTRCSGSGPEATRGPAAHPFRALAQPIDCYFTVIPDPDPLPPGTVSIEGFDVFEIPAILVDLTPFGDLDRVLCEGFRFVHRPYGRRAGGEGRCLLVYGAELHPIRAGDGRRLLVWPCPDACHLDLLGVCFSGGSRLRVREDGVTGIGIRDAERTDLADCLIGRFHGEEYQLLPAHVADSGLDGHPEPLALDLAELEMALHTGWLTGETTVQAAGGAEPRSAVGPRSGGPHWQGAGSAQAFTLLAYADLLARLPAGWDPIDPEVGSPSRPDAGARTGPPFGRSEGTRRQGQEPGAGLPSFASFARRPDLALALLSEPEAGPVAQLRARWHRIESGPEPERSPRSPAAALAAVLEPGADGLDSWIDARPPGQQRAIWRFMLGGGRASAWRDLESPQEGTGEDLGLDPGVDRRGALLVWCARAALREGFAFPPPPGPSQAADPARIVAALAVLEESWGLARGRDPEPLPVWGPQRAAEARRALSELDSGLGRAEQALAQARAGAGDVQADLAEWLARIAAARERIAAQTVWDHIRVQAESLKGATGDPRLAELWGRMTRSTPAQWGVLAAELDRLVRDWAA